MNFLNGFLKPLISHIFQRLQWVRNIHDQLYRLVIHLPFQGGIQTNIHILTFLLEILRNHRKENASKE